MKSNLLEASRAGGYLLGVILFLWLGQWSKTHITILDGYVYLILRNIPHQFISFPLWVANIFATVLLFWTLFLLMPIFLVPRQRWLQIIIFGVFLLICALPLHVHIDSERSYAGRLLPLSYCIILSSVGVAIGVRGIIRGLLRRFHFYVTHLFDWLTGVHTWMFLFWLSLFSFLSINLISLAVFEHTPRYSDSCVYLFQARLFAEGMLYTSPPSDPDFFSAAHTILTDKWYSQYPPGYPALLALGVILGIPWVVNPFLGALTIVCIYLLAKEIYGDGVARLSAVLASISSFFLLMSSEFMAHTSTLFFVTSAVLSFVWMLKGRRGLLSSVVCGTSLGIAVLCRPYTTVCICVPLGIAALVKQKQLVLWQVLVGLVPFLGGCVVFFVYNYATTGHPLIFGYIALHGKGHYPGFHLDPSGEEFHTISQGIKYVLGNLNALNYYLFEWPMPSMFFFCTCLVFCKKRFWEWLFVGWIGALIIGHFFYYFNGLDFGPRFIYEALPALVLLTSQGIILSIRWLEHQTHDFLRARNTVFLALSGLFLLAFLFQVPSTAMSYKRFGSSVSVQNYLDRKQVPRALVFMKDKHLYLAHYPFNAPFAKPHIYAKDRGSENKKLAEKFPEYRYFIADEKKVVEVSIDEL